MMARRWLSVLICVHVGMPLVSACGSLKAGTWTFWLPWPASRIEQVYPEDVTPWPIPGYLPNYEVGYFRGYELHCEPRTLDEGAWSRNYMGPERYRPSWHRWWRASGSYLSGGPRPWPFW